MPRLIQSTFFFDFVDAWNTLCGPEAEIKVNTFVQQLLRDLRFGKHPLPTKGEIDLALTRLQEFNDWYYGASPLEYPEPVRDFQTMVLWQHRSELARHMAQSEALVLDEEAALEAMTNEMLAAQDRRIEEDGGEWSQLTDEEQINQFQPELDYMLWHQEDTLIHGLAPGSNEENIPNRNV